jgi:hypothetical protein
MLVSNALLSPILFWNYVLTVGGLTFADPAGHVSKESHHERRLEIDALGQKVPKSLSPPVIPQALPPMRRFSGPGMLELELVLQTTDLSAQCEVLRDNADNTAPNISAYRGSCVSLVNLEGLQVNNKYQFQMYIIKVVRDFATNWPYEFHGPKSLPITFVTAGFPSWNEATPNATSLGSTVILISWIEALTGGSQILGYQVFMENNETVVNGSTVPQLLYDGATEPTVRQFVHQDLQYGLTYKYSVYAINTVGRSAPSNVSYTVAVPLETNFFYPLSTDPSLPKFQLPSNVTAGVENTVVIQARHAVTGNRETTGGRMFLAALHDACQLDITRQVCNPVFEDNARYQDYRQRLKQPPTCCFPSTDNKDGSYNLSYTGVQTGLYSLMVHQIFQNGLWGTYWDNAYFRGVPVLSRMDANISFNWGSGVITALAGKFVTARWVGYIKAPATNEYTFYIKVDDYVRFWVQGVLLIDNWDSNEPCCPDKWTRVNMAQDQFYDIRVDYKQMQGDAQLLLYWSLRGRPRQIIPAKHFWRRAPLVNTPYDVNVISGPASVLTSGLLEPLEVVYSGVFQQIYLQALDSSRNPVALATDIFDATFVGPYPNGTDEGMLFNFTSKPMMARHRDPSMPPVRDYMHVVDFLLKHPGNYTLHLFLRGVGELVQSPIEIVAKIPIVIPQRCTVTGPAIDETFVAGVETNFTLQLRDAFDNKAPHVNGTKVYVEILWTEDLRPNRTINELGLINQTLGYRTLPSSTEMGPDGTYFIRFTAFRAGKKLSLREG